MQLALRTETKYIDEIIAGKKTSEFRAFVEFYISRLCLLDSKGEITDFKPIKTLKLYAGNVTGGRSVTAEVTGIFINNYPEENNEKEFEIELGKVIAYN